MAWYVLYDNATGRKISESSSDIPAQAGRTVLQLADRPQETVGGVMWDEATRTFIARPPKVLIDRLEDIQTNPNFSDFMTAYNTLSAANKTRLRNMIIRLLGRYRFRNPSEPVELE